MCVHPEIHTRPDRSAQPEFVDGNFVQYEALARVLSWMNDRNYQHYSSSTPIPRRARALSTGHHGRSSITAARTTPFLEAARIFE